MQSLAVVITLILSLIVAACFYWVLTHTRGKANLADIAPSAYKARAWLFGVVMVVGVGIAYVTLVPWPHDAGAAEVTRRIDINSRQWSWDIQEQDRHIRVGEVVEFRVSSTDVNHGFGLYDPDQKMVAQIQAMPGFVNTVRHRFSQPGTYQILCMEYCGVAHHVMMTNIEVSESAAQ